MARKNDRRKIGCGVKALIAGVLLLLIFIVAGVWLYYHSRELSDVVKMKFAGKKWELPARIYARPLELYPGMAISPQGLAQEFDLMRYRQVEALDGPGSYSVEENQFILFSRSFTFEDGSEPAKKLRLKIENGRMQEITDVETGKASDGLRLDPARIASIYPTHQEDRILVKLKEASPLVIQTLIAVEDRSFYRHHGIAPLSILRALIANIRSLRKAQGGSTLTQQLVKNFFLTRERTFKRKFDEMIMAMILESRYDKDEILEAYLNEVYLGQHGSRAIHGFGLASHFYFGRPLEDLRPREVALLVAILKGPSFYDPRRNPERAKERRDMVLDIMAELKLVNEDEAAAEKQMPLAVIEIEAGGTEIFPAFTDLVKRQLLKEYREEDLRTEGLRIFTSFDPQAQFAVEGAVTEGMAALEERRNLPDAAPEERLETGVIVTDTAANEVLALMGGRTPRFPGFNRALDAKRPIGSLIKPAIYLTALSQPEKYTLITPIDDSRMEIVDKHQGPWIPKNYDRQYHGYVPLYEALVHSYNSATVRLGMGMGLEKVFETLKKLGVEEKIPPYPSTLLGTLELSPLAVAQMYQTLAAGGFFSPARAIRSVYTPDHKPLQRYPLTVRQSFDPGPVFLINTSLQAVAVEGTARRLMDIVNRDLAPAGKTGTTNDLKDSWFAGFTGNRLATVWVGRDDNGPTGLTGASGALRVWGEIMNRIAAEPLSLPRPQSVEWVVVEPFMEARTEAFCAGAVSVPFIAGSAPEAFYSCRLEPETPPAPDTEPESEERPSSKPGIFNWLKEVFE